MCNTFEPIPFLICIYFGECALAVSRTWQSQVRYPRESIVELEVPPDETPGLMTFTPTTPTYYNTSRPLNHNTHPTDLIRDKKTNAFDTSMASPSRQHNCAVRVSHRYIITVAEFGRSRRPPSLGAPTIEYRFEFRFKFRRSRRVWALPLSLGDPTRSRRNLLS